MQHQSVFKLHQVRLSVEPPLVASWLHPPSNELEIVMALSQQLLVHSSPFPTY